MTVAIDPALDAKRGCADHALECAARFRPNQLTIRTRTWPSGRRGGLGNDPVDVDFVLPKKHPIREVNTREILGSGGRLNVGDVIVEELVPAYTSHGGGGYTKEQLAPLDSFAATENAKEVIYIVDGDISGYFTLSSLQTTGPIFWQLLLTRSRDRARQGDAS